MTENLVTTLDRAQSFGSFRQTYFSDRLGCSDARHLSNIEITKHISEEKGFLFSLGSCFRCKQMFISFFTLHADGTGVYQDGRAVCHTVGTNGPIYKSVSEARTFSDYKISCTTNRKLKPCGWPREPCQTVGLSLSGKGLWSSQ